MGVHTMHTMCLHNDAKWTINAICAAGLTKSRTEIMLDGMKMVRFGLERTALYLLAALPCSILAILRPVVYKQTKQTDA